MRSIVANWRTSLAGVAVLGIGAALATGKISVQEFLAAFAAVTGSGFLLAQDGVNKT